MRHLAHHRPWLLSLLLAALWVLFGAPAQAQVDSLWDHYKVYRLVNPGVASPPIPVALQDQFGQFTHQAFRMPLFANPVEKRVPDATGGTRIYPIHDPVLHYTWWELNPPQPFQANVRVDNQFGFQELLVFEGLFLLNPALKDTLSPPPPPVPVRNHYKCYRCEGQPVNIGVVLADQFDVWQTTVVFPRFFCNPVAKSDFSGSYPIITPRQHYTVYEFNPVDPGNFPLNWRDQFGTGQGARLSPGILLMVPTDKLLVTDAKTSTWGKIKSLYR